MQERQSTQIIRAQSAQQAPKHGPGRAAVRHVQPTPWKPSDHALAAANLVATNPEPLLPGFAEQEHPLKKS